MIVSVAAPEIFRDEILSTPRLGCVNLHSGRLPKFRGMMPTFWQMLGGESRATVTVHEMAREVDAGRILGTAECAIHERDTVDRVMVEAKIVGARLMIGVLGKIAERHGRSPTARHVRSLVLLVSHAARRKGAPRAWPQTSLTKARAPASRPR